MSLEVFLRETMSELAARSSVFSVHHPLHPQLSEEYRVRLVL